MAVYYTKSKRSRKSASLKVFYFLPVRVFESQSKPSYKPSPVVAQQAWMYHFLLLISTEEKGENENKEEYL